MKKDCSKLFVRLKGMEKFFSFLRKMNYSLQLEASYL